MKIQGHGPNTGVDATGTTGTAKADAIRKRLEGVQENAGAGAGDTVQLSADAQLADRVRQAIAATPAVRADLVEAARAKLAEGDVAQDPLALADRLIDQMLDE